MYHSTELKIVRKKKCGGCNKDNGGDLDKEYEGFDFSSLE